MSAETKAMLTAAAVGLVLAGAAGFLIGWRAGRPKPSDLMVQDLGGCRRG